MIWIYFLSSAVLDAMEGRGKLQQWLSLTLLIHTFAYLAVKSAGVQNFLSTVGWVVFVFQKPFKSFGTTSLLFSFQSPFSSV